MNVKENSTDVVMGMGIEDPPPPPQQHYGTGARPGESQNTITGTDGSEYLIGGSLNDTIHGLGGADTLIGNGGDDRLYGEGGNDTLFAGTGQNILIGGTGSDYFYLADNGTYGVTSVHTGDLNGGDDGVMDVIHLTGTGQVYIFNFNPNQDRLSIWGYSADNLPQGTWQSADNRTAYGLSSGLIVYVLGVHPEAITASDYIFN